MSSTSSNSLISANFTQAARAEGSLSGLTRNNKSGADASERFAQLMKSYGGAQATPPKPETSLPAAAAESAAKPNVPPPVHQPAQDKSEQQRQEEKLTQKKITLNSEAKPRPPVPGQAQKGKANMAVSGAAENRQTASTGPSSTAASSESTEQAQPNKSKSCDLSGNSVAADATAAAAAQQASIGAALIDTASSDAVGAAAGLSQASQGAEEKSIQSQALLAATDSDAIKDQSGTAPGAKPMATGPARTALHAQQTAGSGALQAKQAGEGPTTEMAPGSSSNFSRELQTAQTNLVNGQAEPRSEGFSLSGLVTAAGIAAPATFEARSERPNEAQLSFSQPLTDPGFAPEMAARLSVLAADGVQEARLHLNPAEMGPVSVQIIVEGQQAQVSFHAEHEQTRAVLEQSLPDLAAALRDSGLTLSGGGVFQQPGDQNRQPQPGAEAATERSSGFGNNLSLGASSPAAAAQIRPARGVVDLYA
ncbi:flagellar hook-length control protein FliK [Paucibacter sp. B2R-40]|uniref:flagellar hook-length control protein FliK n=1 Tax=Paucibacter sp. B2R-40 TaxID=2893554 RepID=UPI0021E46A9E|nr:flagellar hook-length control protein FliK [Paucibacter sp. B2R-40]MCV2355025.1 flagellar hook-length control protein FliK [Paucibacter sp. B2R-40]